MLPRRKDKPRSGIMRAPKREWPKHRAFVRRHECCVSNGFPCHSQVEFAHVRTGTDGGTGIKPSDWWGISLCRFHHMRQHALGEPEFERVYGINMKKVAAEFAARSPDIRMREAMRHAA